jgi:hypothetical protein
MPRQWRDTDLPDLTTSQPLHAANFGPRGVHVPLAAQDWTDILNRIIDKSIRMVTNNMPPVPARLAARFRRWLSPKIPNMQSPTAHKLEVYQPPNLSRETKEWTLLLGAFLSRYRAAMALLCLDRQLPSIESIAVDLTGGIPDSYCVWRPFLQCKPRLFRPFLFALEKSVEEMGCHGVGVWKSRGSVDLYIQSWMWVDVPGTWP